MNEMNAQMTNPEPEKNINFGHLKPVVAVAILLLGISWMKDPQLFDVFKSRNKLTAAADAGVPRYYAYEPTAENTQPQVLGASTEAQGPVIINDDGSVTPVDMGQVLGASTEGVELSLDDIKVNSVPGSSETIKKYFNETQTIEGEIVDETEFASALNSGNQEQINQQAKRLSGIRDSLLQLSVPQNLIKLHKLKIIQYDSAATLLQNFTSQDQGSETVMNNLQRFIKSQQDLDTENALVAAKYPDEFPNAAVYLDSEIVTADIDANKGQAE